MISFYMQHMIKPAVSTSTALWFVRQKKHISHLIRLQHHSQNAVQFEIRKSSYLYYHNYVPIIDATFNTHVYGEVCSQVKYYCLPVGFVFLYNFKLNNKMEH